MIVPPYVPDMLEVEGNVAGDAYAVRLHFLRKVSIWHYLSVLGVAAVAAAPLPTLPLSVSLSVFCATLLGLSVMRQLTKPRTVDQVYSSVLMPLLLISLAFVVRHVSGLGFPIWAPAIGLSCALAYTQISGRDFSFVWLYILTLADSSIIIWLLSLATPLSGMLVLEALLLNGAYLLYFTYDLACIQSRRRKTEIAGAVIDLYRDVLNFLTYSIRAVRHWKRYRIWSVPRSGKTG
ncbi:MAG: hypothetical protein WAO58_12430 [Fimbriimonadaceae bacterium]